jgi:nitrate reductase NapE component
VAIADSSLPRLGNALILRAIPALIAAVVITFSRNHAPAVGLAVFVGFAFLLASALIFTIMSAPLDGLNRTLFGIQAMVTVVSAAIASATLTGGLPALLLVLSIWAGLSAALELYAGYREPNRTIAKEWLTIGGFTAILAIIEAVVPMNDVYAVGIFGAYAAIVSVYQIIAGISLRTDATTSIRKVSS